MWACCSFRTVADVCLRNIDRIPGSDISAGDRWPKLWGGRIHIVCNVRNCCRLWECYSSVQDRFARVYHAGLDISPTNIHSAWHWHWPWGKRTKARHGVAHQFLCGGSHPYLRPYIAGDSVVAQVGHNGGYGFSDASAPAYQSPQKKKNP